MKKILVTDSLFIFDEHIKQLNDAGYEVERIDNPNATEDELIEALKGKAGYVLGGIEKVTDKVLQSTDTLKAIAFTGADWQFFIPGWQTAKEKGIAIANSPGANSVAVAEFAIATALSMQRNLYELGRTGDKTFETTKSIQSSVVGVIGAGKIGSEIIKMAGTFHPSKVIYYSRTQKGGLGADYTELEDLLSQSDVIFVSVPESAGQLIDADKVNKIKDGALIVSISSNSVIDFDTLLPRLQNGTIRAAVDWPPLSDEYKKLPLHIWFNSNDHAAFNTHAANKIGSDMGTQSLINLLESGQDQYKVA